MATLFDNIEIPNFEDNIGELILSEDMGVEYDNNLLSKIDSMIAFIEASTTTGNSLLLKLMSFSGDKLQLDREYIYTDTLNLRAESIELSEDSESSYTGIISRLNAESSAADRYWRMGEYVEIKNSAVILPGEDYILTNESSMLLLMHRTNRQTMISPLGSVHSSIRDSAIKDLSAVSSKTASNSFLLKNSVLDLNNFSVSTKSFTMNKDKIVFSEQSSLSNTMVKEFKFKEGTVTIEEVNSNYMLKTSMATNTGILPTNTNLTTNFEAETIMRSNFVKTKQHEFGKLLKRGGAIDDAQLAKIADEVLSGNISLGTYSNKPLTYRELSFVVNHIVAKIKTSIGEC